MSHQSNNTLGQTDSEMPTIGSTEWYAERWRNQFNALCDAIKQTEMQILSFREQQLKPFAAELARPFTAQDREFLRNSLRLMLEDAPADDYMLAGLKAYANSPLINQETGEPKKEDAILQQYYLPGAIKKQVEVLRKLREFAEIAFAFFYDGFYPQQAQEALSGSQQQQMTTLILPDDDVNELRHALNQATNALFFASAHHPPNDVLGTLLEQVSIDLNIVQQAFQQRQIGTLRAKLFMADNFARMALKPAIDSGFLDARFHSALCYLNKGIEIRLLPYHELIFIGIPFTANVIFGRSTGSTSSASADSYVSTDYLAIPHEIGHYLYQYGHAPGNSRQRPASEPAKRPLAKIVQEQLREELSKQPGGLQKSSWVYTWLEEIFADAYGCLVAGPVSVLGILEVLTNHLPSDHESESDKHPIPFLRPLIQTQILRAIQDQSGNRLYDDEAEQLDAHWRQWVKTHWTQWVDQQWPYGYGAQTDILGEATYNLAGQTMTGQEILAELQPAIDVILSILNRLRPQDTASTWTPGWNTQKYTDAQKVTGLFSHFKYFAVVEGLVSFADTLSVDVSSDTQPAPSPDFRWLSNQLEQLQRQRYVRPGFDALVEALLFEGWSMEGPTGGSIRIG